MDVLSIKKRVIEIPILFMYPAAFILERLLEKPPITIQQLIMLEEDNICDIKEMKEVFGLELVPLEEALKSFLPQGGGKNP